jgi:hypothetical protein
MRVYGRGLDDRLYENAAAVGTSGSWTLARLSDYTVESSSGVAILGTPSAAVLASGQPLVVVRDASGNVAAFQIISGQWHYASWALPSGHHVTLSPLAVPTGAYVRAEDRNSWFFSTTGSATSLLGQID